MVGLRAGLLAAVGLACLVNAPARAEDDAAADVAFWQSIQGDKDPAELKAYLAAFPNGRFAPLARIRLKGGSNVTPPPGPTPAPAPAPAPLPEPDPDPEPLPEQILVNPARGRVGQYIQFTCVNFPDPLMSDQLVVVPEGTPDMDPTRNPEDTKVVWKDYAFNCKRGPIKGGPFPPGRYEVRFMTGLYNLEKAFEVKARAPLAIR